MWVTARGELTRKQCDELAKEMSVKQVLLDRILSGIGSVLLATAIGIIAAVLLGHMAVCEQYDRMCLITGSDS